MRSSIVLLPLSALLCFPLTLAAQLAPGGAPSVFVQPNAASACPVQFRVDRKLDGALIEASAEQSFLRAHASLSLPAFQAALQAEPGFSSLAPAAQQQKLDHMSELYRQSQGSGLDLDFTHARPILAAEIVVHGYLPAAHITPAARSSPREVTETFHLTPATGQAVLVRSSVWTSQKMTVTWVELASVDFTNGTHWQSSAPDQCAVAPSLFVPVAQ